MTPQELKNSILQLAIQGKLVEQRAEEGTAEELFQQIQEEKQRLIAEKKIKKEKPLPEIAEEEKPFDIPDSWKWVRLGNCGSWGSGATPSRTNLEYYGGSIPWLKTGDLNDGIVTEIPEYITQLALEKTSVRLNPSGSVLMAMYGATIGKLGILGINATTNQACCACIPYEGIYNKYLFFFLMASRTVFIKMGEGGAQPNISKEKIVNAIIPLPPLAEQKRIVAKIEELLPYIDQYEEAWSKLEQFNKRFPEDMKKSLLQYAIEGKLVEQRAEEGTAEELFQQIQAEKQRLIAEKKIKKEKPLPEITEEEKPFDIPDSWKWVRLGNLVSKLGSGSTPSGGKAVYLDSGVKFLRSQNIYNDGLRLNDVVYISEATNAKKSGSIVYAKDVLLNITGGSIGRCALVPDDFGYANVNQHVMIVRAINEFTRYWIHMILISPYIQNLIMAVQVGVSREGLSAEKAKKFMIPFPPLDEQKRIVEKLKQLLPLCERLK